MLNTSTIDRVTGGTITGPVGIDNDARGTITSIDVAAEGDLVVTGTDGPAVQNAGTATLTGKGIYIGKDNAIENAEGGTTTLEPGLTAARDARLRRRHHHEGARARGLHVPALEGQRVL